MSGGNVVRWRGLAQSCLANYTAPSVGFLGSPCPRADPVYPVFLVSRRGPSAGQATSPLSPLSHAPLLESGVVDAVADAVAVADMASATDSRVHAMKRMGPAVSALTIRTPSVLALVSLLLAYCLLSNLHGHIDGTIIAYA